MPQFVVHLFMLQGTSVRSFTTMNNVYITCQHFLKPLASPIKRPTGRDSLRSCSAGGSHVAYRLAMPSGDIPRAMHV
jgi:hypothetical protein